MIIAFGEFLKADCQACIDKTNYSVHKPNILSHVMVGTPACVSSLIAKKSLQSKFIKIFLLDKANELLSPRVYDKIKKIKKFLKEDVQVILLSVPMSKDILDKSSHLVCDPLHIFMHKEQQTLKGVYSNPNCCFFLVNYKLCFIYLGIKNFFINFTKEECKFDILCNLFDTLSITQAVIFCNTQRKVEWLTENMRLKQFNILAMYEEMNKHQCSITMSHFRSGSICGLITTNLLARTIDVRQVSLVINYDFPFNCEKFINNIVHSGCFLQKGVVINFITEDVKCAM